MLNNWKFRDLTLLGFSIPTSLIFIFSGMVYLTASQAGGTFRQVGISSNAMIGANDMVVSMKNMDLRIRRCLLAPEEKKEALELYAKDRQRFQEGLKLATSVVEDAAQKERLQKLTLLENELNILAQQTLLNFKDNTNQKEVINNYVNQSKEINNIITQMSDDFDGREQEIMGKSIDLTKTSINFLILLTLAFSMLSITVATIATLLIAKYLGNKVSTAIKVAEKISIGDLTSSIAEDVSQNKDEMGQLLKAFKTMTHSLNNLIRKLQQSGIQVSSSTTQIASSGKQLEATIAEQVASTNQVAAAAKEISATSRELLKTMETVAATSQTTTTKASDSQKDLIRMETTMRQLVEATNTIAARLGVISEKANNINSIVVTITKVADQTNLLSLNAAIEAEKAGEYGLGFAVVAREIRRLADQTAVATLDIEQMVKQMQSSVSTGVMEMDKFATEVGRTVEDVARISSQIGQVIEQVQDLTPQFEAVNQGMDTQSQGAQQISDAMVQLSSTSLQTADSLREINSAIAQLNQVANGLRQEISRFKLVAENSTYSLTELIPSQL
ncbi:MAG: methyl-accepting chemotaxis protein [Chlorogloeopsis fritschii C42_A2020_084]|uniref:methyl-accepting chemotaxis protein n=1 Tax=Chlorogloeopsis fritschii TaxID=1124 RepID=UPI0019DD6FF4|nr:methyl-accepting chemotaxis protein [Chlorogloeopsis fritschii]MBF2006266.1 methyl-accepting chemotaxis protein [Chlorogloeopsis fritschii C42_A2020_084]